VLTHEDRKRLYALNIRAVVDLRSTGERYHRPHGLFGQPDLHYVAHNHDRSKGNLARALEEEHGAKSLRDAMIDLYRTLPYDLSEGYRQLFRAVVCGPLPLAFNCAAGKDRTGVAAALLLSTLGVSWDDVMADYLLTEKFIPDIIRMYGSSKTTVPLGRFDANLTAPLFAVDPAYLEAMREGVTAQSGSIEDYVRRDLRISSNDVAELRQRLLD
jgi:protein-tyrosine phosphatase